MNTKTQTADQTLKGLIVGVLGYVAAKNNWPAEISLPLMGIVPALLAFISTKIGDPALASFLGTADADKK